MPEEATDIQGRTFLCTDTMFTLQADDATKLERVGVSVDETESYIYADPFLFTIYILTSQITLLLIENIINI